jgi:hypothetical protein
MGALVGFAFAGLLGQANPSGSAVRPANQANGARETSGTVVLSSQAADGSQLLYIVDTNNQSFAVYRVDPRDNKGAVKLEAARQYRWDLKLAEFNNQAPEVATIESMVGAPRR